MERIQSYSVCEAPIKTSELQYDLPQELIAQRPCEPRDAARLMVLHRATGRIEHRIFRDLPEHLSPGDCLVLNSTKVLPARFEARRATGGRIEGLFVEELSPGKWRVLLTGVGRLREGETLHLAAQSACQQPHPDPPLSASGGSARGGIKEREWGLTVLRRLERGEAEVRVVPADPSTVVLDRIGTMPLPPYIRREGDEGRLLDAADRVDYQTVYASAQGAVAAPTAGLHFTPALLDAIRGQGIGIAEVVLHLGLGTFAPIEVEDLAHHRMHKEWYSLPAKAAETIRATRAAGGRIIAVGTTSVRVLETCAGPGDFSPQEGWTDILIYPPYEFRAVDGLVTNFHLPGSTLMALVCALAGRDIVMRAYQSAIAERYRFYSYGDALLVV